MMVSLVLSDADEVSGHFEIKCKMYGNYLDGADWGEVDSADDSEQSENEGPNETFEIETSVLVKIAMI